MLADADDRGRRRPQLCEQPHGFIAAGARVAHGMVTALTVGLVGQHVLAVEVGQHDGQLLVRHRQQPRQQAVLHDAVRVRRDRRCWGLGVRAASLSTAVSMLFTDPESIRDHSARCSPATSTHATLDSCWRSGVGKRVGIFSTARHLLLCWLLLLIWI